MIDSKIPIINSEFQLEKFDNEILLYTITGTKAVYLNETALLVWELCGKNKSVGEIITMLEDAYPEQKQSIRDDVNMVIKTLSENGFEGVKRYKASEFLPSNYFDWSLHSLCGINTSLNVQCIKSSQPPSWLASTSCQSINPFKTNLQNRTRQTIFKRLFGYYLLV